ncbi:MAG: tRNA (adenosine(37)-N6)-threonylcarbamoyltransferase complex transferase subunit TsaD, partial [Desulfovibrionales bacterium]|nr:tRNA (adenosine(37)-N6)-threonylcarbamoyltransferase complex transferase subunit TsaD [Desulfovibrionales bacterium]
VKSLILSGGVAANTLIRKTLSNTAYEHDLELVMPELSLCTDNAAMVAWYGYLLAQKGLHHSLDLEAIPRGKPIPWDYLKSE